MPRSGGSPAAPPCGQAAVRRFAPCALPPRSGPATSPSCHPAARQPFGDSPPLRPSAPLGATSPRMRAVRRVAPAPSRRCAGVRLAPAPAPACDWPAVAVRRPAIGARATLGHLVGGNGEWMSQKGRHPATTGHPLPSRREWMSRFGANRWRTGTRWPAGWAALGEGRGATEQRGGSFLVVTAADPARPAAAPATTDSQRHWARFLCKNHKKRAQSLRASFGDRDQTG